MKGLLVDRLEDLATDQEARDALYQWVVEKGITRVGLYVSNSYLTELPEVNRSMMENFRSKGIEVYAVLSPSSHEPLKLKSYLPKLKAFDGIFLEYEFWHLNRSFCSYKRYCRKIKRKAPELNILQYMGWPALTYRKSFRRFRFMQSVGNEIAIHMYRKKVDLLYVRNRLMALNTLSQTSLGPMKAYILFSSEPAYMSELLKTNGLQEIYDSFYQKYESQTDFNSLDLNGWFWFKASELVPY